MVRAAQVMSAEIRDRLLQQQFRDIKAIIGGLHATDILDILRDLEPEYRALLFRLLPKDKAADVFTEMETDEQQDLLNRLTDETVTELLHSMAPDDRTELLEEMPASVVARLIRLMSPRERREAITLLNYPPDSAGRIMTPEYVAVRPYTRVQEVLDRIRRTDFDKETIYNIYVIDDQRHLVGVFSLRELLLAEPSEPVAQFMIRDVIAVRTTDDQETVVQLMKRYDFLAIPVVDSENRLVGIVTIDDAMDVLEEEATEDIQRMASMGPIEESYLHARWWTLVRKRVVWLIGLLVGETFTSHIMEGYETLMRSFIVLAMFIPVIMGAAGNVGTQSSALVIRSIAIGEMDRRRWLQAVFREAFIGGIIGTILAVMIMGRVWWSHQNLGAALAVGLSLWLVVFVANMLGALLPIVGQLLRLDPAVMAGPLITTVMDVLSVAIYLSVAAVFLRPGA